MVCAAASNAMKLLCSAMLAALVDSNRSQNSITCIRALAAPLIVSAGLQKQRASRTSEDASAWETLVGFKAEALW